MTQTAQDAFALKQPTTALTARYMAQNQGSHKQQDARPWIPHLIWKQHYTKFLVAAEVLILILFNATHLQGNPQWYQNSWW